MAAAKAVGCAAAALNLCTLALLLDFISCGNLLRFGTMNGNVTLAPSVAVDFKEIIWKKGKDKVVEWGVGREVKSYQQFRGRVHLDTKLGDLFIVNLTSLDEDEYEIESVDLREDVKFFLKILDPLPSPTLRCTLTNESIEIHCEIPESYRRYRQEIQYEWRCPFAPCGKGFLLGIPSPLKLADLQSQKDYLSQKVECVIGNPESNRTSSIVLSACVADANLRMRYGLIPVPLVVIFFIIGFVKCVGKTESTNPT